MPEETTSLLQTKLRRPALTSDLVLRPGLMNQLNDGVGSRLTLVCAPAGFGKTTLVSSWIESISSIEERKTAHLPAAWLSLDYQDSDLVLFIRYLIAALRTIFKGACAETLQLFQGQQFPPLRLVAATLSNEIEKLPQSFILVLDDFHSIQGEAIPGLLNELLQHGPQTLHLVLISRNNPPLPLPRLRANGELTEIRSNDLRFDITETAAFLSQALQAPYSARAVEMLNEKIEGWIGALRLATLSLRKASSVEESITAMLGSEDNIADYLADEVLAYQMPAIQTFLLNTSILDRFCASLCEAVIGEPDPAWSVPACIDWLEREGLFVIPLDQNKQWYRYHHLFLDLLRHRARIELGADQFTSLHRRAAEWFSRHGMVDQALHHSLEAGDVELVAQLMASNLREVLNREDRPTLERWLRLLPVALIQKRPELLIIKAWVHQFSWQLDAQAGVLRQVEALLESDDKNLLPSGDLQALHGQVAVLKAQHAYFGNYQDRVRAYCQEALSLLPESWRYLHSGVMMYLGLSLQASGESRAAERMLRDHYKAQVEKIDVYALRLLMTLDLIYLHDGNLIQVYQTARVLLSQSAERGLAILKSWAHFFLGTVLYYWNDLEAASGHFNELVQHRYTSHGITVCDGITGQALIHQIRGEKAEAWQMVDLLSQMDVERMGAEEDRTRSLRARLKLLEGDLEAAIRWASAFTAPPSAQPFTWLETPHLTQARILLARKLPADVLKAHQVLDTLDDIAERTYNTRFRIEILALRALALDAEGHPSAALNTLQQAVDLAQPGGFIRPFVELGPGMLELLGKLAQKGQSIETVRNIMAGFPDQDFSRPLGEVQSPSNRQPAHQFPVLIEPLTTRERQILVQLSEPVSIKEIAVKLGISYATAKRHTINIYGKLGVNSRWEAVAKANEQGLFTAS